MTIDAATEFRSCLREADALFAKAIMDLILPLRRRHDSKRAPRQELLQAARRIWIADIPTFGSLAGPTPIIGHHRLRIAERRAASASYLLPEWYRQDGPPAIAIVDIVLTVRPGECSLRTNMRELFDLPEVAAWGDDFMGRLAQVAAQYPEP
jgi:hypothetical protein